jgi:hypothetical protein
MLKVTQLLCGPRVVDFAHPFIEVVFFTGFHSSLGFSAFPRGAFGEVDFVWGRVEIGE